MSKHRNAGLTPFQTVPMSSKKCQRFRFEHPFTSMTAGMTKSGKAAWVLSLLHQASEAIYLPPEVVHEPTPEMWLKINFRSTPRKT